MGDYEKKNGDSKFVRNSTYGVIQDMGDLVTWQSLKLKFDPLYDDAVWRDMIKFKVRRWKLFQNCGFGPYTLYLLVEKDYPLSNCIEILYKMLKGKIQLQLQQVYWVDNQAFELLKKY